MSPESPRIDRPALPLNAGCQCSICLARRKNVKHPNREAVYSPCLCGHDGDGSWWNCPSCPYHGALVQGIATPPKNQKEHTP